MGRKQVWLLLALLSGAVLACVLVMVLPPGPPEPPTEAPTRIEMAPAPGPPERPREAPAQTEMALEDIALMRSLFEPSDEDVRQSLDAVRELRAMHANVLQVCKEAFQHEPSETTEILNQQFADEEGDWPRAYRGLVRGGLMCDHTRDLAITAVDLCAAGDEFLPVLRKHADAPPHTEYSPLYEFGAGEVYLHVLHGRIRGAIESVGQHVDISRDEGTGQVLALLERIERDRNDLEAWLEVIPALGTMLGGDTYTVARLELYWRLWDRVASDELRARVLLGLDSEIGSDWENGYPGRMITQTLVTASARLLAREASSELKSRAVCRVADAAQGTGREALAAEIYLRAAQAFPDTSEWGRATFNAGHLLRLIGRPAEAIPVLKTLFPSDVDDLEPAPDIMEAYRNYRHSAARRISRAYEDQEDWVRAYEWMKAAAEKYPYQSWCGTCLGQAQEEMKEELARLKWKAGL